MTNMTDEARQAAGERLRAGRENAQKARMATSEQMVEATLSGKMEMTSEDIFALQQGPRTAGDSPTPVAQRDPAHQQATVTHETSAKVWMFKPTPQGYIPKLIPASNIGMVVRNGWLAACPDCGRRECMTNGDQNDCPARPARMYRVCPISSCHKKFYDTLEVALPDDGQPVDPNAIVDDLASRSTPQERTWTELAAHLMAVHPKEAPRYGAVPVTVTAPVMQPIVGTMQGTR